jgi:ferredoxin
VTRWRITVDQDRCVGSATCTSIAPDFFTLDGEDRSRPAAAEVAPEDRFVEAAELCPTSAIAVVDADSGLSQVD